MATGKTLEEMWKVVLQQEQEDPPEPPHGLEAVSTSEFQRLLSRPLSEVILDTSWMGPLRMACSLCGQHLIDMQRIKTHWQMTHKVAWRFVKGEILGDMAALRSAIRRPCQYCGSGASDVNAHSRQCPVLFQLLATRSLHQKGRLIEARSQSASVIERQDKNQPAYAAYSVESSPIGQALGLSRGSKASAVRRSGVAELGLPHSDGAGLSVSPVFGATFSRSFWTLKLVLLNPGNHCYANSSILALCHACSMARSTPAMLRPLLEHLRSKA